MIDGNLVSDHDEGMLGLIANNFIRVYHPLYENPETKALECKNGEGKLTDIEINAAILAINHSFIVDNYDCGSSLGTLHVLGAISQKYRGTVGTSSGPPATSRTTSTTTACTRSPRRASSSRSSPTG